MAYSTPSTFVAGNVLTAAQLNTNLRDNIAWIATDSPVCRAYKSTAFSHNSTGNSLPITLDSERFDNAAIHNTSSSTTRMTIPTGGDGKYLFGGSIEYAANATGVRTIGVRSGGTLFIATQTFQASGTNVTTGSVCSVYSLAAAGYVEMTSYQNSGGNLDINASSAYSPEFWIQWIRN